MTKPWDETWEYVSGGWPYDVCRKGTNEKIADVWATGSEDSHGTAELIAQAPAMARLLLKHEWVPHDESRDYCVECGGTRPEPDDAFSMGHVKGCTLAAVLRLLGVATVVAGQ